MDRMIHIVLPKKQFSSTTKNYLNYLMKKWKFNYNNYKMKGYNTKLF